MSAPVNRTKITVQVHTNARRNEVVGFTEGVLMVKIAAPPVAGKANKKLVEFLSECLGVSKSRLSIVKGVTGRNKIIAIEGLDREEVVKRFTSL